MSVPPEIFDADYLHFYSDLFEAERSDAEADTIASLLSLRKGMRVLDVPCGEGRIAGRLARRGCEMVGVDRTELFIDLARERYPLVTFELGDMRSISYDGEFDAVINWFTSFGYFDPDTNDAVLAGFARALAPGGRLLIELHNPWRLAQLVEAGGGSSSYLIERPDGLMADRVTYDRRAGRSRTERFIVRDGAMRKLEFSLEQIPAPALRARLRRAGFGRVQLFGQGGAPFEPDSRRLLAIAELADAGDPQQISLRQVDGRNVEAVCDLKLAPEQERYVAPNGQTLAESACDPRAWVRAIYADDEPVGLLALVVVADEPRYLLVHMMVGAQHQGRGYGRTAIARLADHVRTLPGAQELETSCVPGPDSPRGFYERLGFVDTGRVWHGENVLTLAL